jgi:hypothetical protein
VLRKDRKNGSGNGSNHKEHQTDRRVHDGRTHSTE